MVLGVLIAQTTFSGVAGQNCNNYSFIGQFLNLDLGCYNTGDQNIDGLDTSCFFFGYIGIASALVFASTYTNR